jgi:hypothetical protein
MKKLGQKPQTTVSENSRGKASFLASLTLLLSTALLPISHAQKFVWAPGFPIGAPIPDITSQDQNGVVRDYNSIRGDRGVIFLLNRSFDW